MSAALAWTLAGSDPSGGAGLQADVKTLQDLGVTACSITTALTAQSLSAVRAVEAVPLPLLEAQWQALAAAHAPAVIKIGMLRGLPQVHWLAERLQQYPGAPVVCDPVLFASDGSELQQPGVREAFLQHLLPRITLLTPNLPEARWLLGSAVSADAGPEVLAQALQRAGAQAVLVKGGHATDGGPVWDRFCSAGDAFWMGHARLPGWLHGSGCILASAVAAALALGYALDDAVVLGRRYLQQGWRLAAAGGAAEGRFVHAGWPADARDLPCVGHAPVVPSLAFPAMGLEPIGLYPVVDSVDWLRCLLPLGVSTLQLRIKQAAPAVVQAAVTDVVALGRHYGARVFINDHWQAAIDAGAFGVHLGQEDLDTADLAAIAQAGLRLGISNHSEREIARAQALRPSYMALGPVFATTTKVMRFAPQGLERLRGWVSLLGGQYPLVAIGGIDAANQGSVLATGVGNVAVVRAITQAADPVQAVRQLRATQAAYGAGCRGG